MVNQDIFIDFYDMFELDRGMTEKEIRDKLSRRQAEVIMWKGSTDRNNTQVLNELQEIIGYLRRAISTLGKPDSRREYDAQLDAAIRAGKVNRKTAENMHDILERARAFFEQGKYDLALKCAQEAVENHVNSEEPHELITRSYFMLGDYDEASEAISNAVNIYSSSLRLRWLNIRLLIMLERFGEAHALLNKSLVDFNNHSQLVAEQIYLYGYAGRDDLIEDTIRKHIDHVPHDVDYRRYVAINLVDIAELCFVYDSASSMRLITEENSYNRCIKLLTIANGIYQDEFIKNELEYALRFGTLVYDTDHNGLKLFYCIGGIILLILAIWSMPATTSFVLAAVGVLFEFAAVVVKRLSYRPYWKVYRDAYRGFKESDDGLLYNVLLLPWEMVKQILGAFC